MNNYALDIGYKTDLKLPNGKHIALKDGDRLEFTMIDDRDEKESIVEERFYINRLDWKDDLVYGIKYAIAESKYLDRIDRAHISPDMLINKTASRELGFLEIGILEDTNKIKLAIPSNKFYSIPEALDIILIRDNCKENSNTQKNIGKEQVRLALNEIESIIRKYKLSKIVFDESTGDDERVCVAASSTHYSYSITDIIVRNELYEEK